MTALAMIDGRLAVLSPLLQVPGPYSGHLTQPESRDSQAQGMFIVLAGTRQVEAGVSFFVMKEGKRGTIVCTIDGRTGAYTANGCGSVTLRAVIGTQHIDQVLTLHGRVSDKDIA